MPRTPPAPPAPPVYDSGSPMAPDTSSHTTPRGNARPRPLLRPPLPIILDDQDIDIIYTYDPAASPFAEAVFGEGAGDVPNIEIPEEWRPWFGWQDRGPSHREDDVRRIKEGKRQYLAWAQGEDDVMMNMIERVRIAIIRLTAFVGLPWFETEAQREWLLDILETAHEGAVRQTGLCSNCKYLLL